jgi:hypothetical protein
MVITGAAAPGPRKDHGSPVTICRVFFYRSMILSGSNYFPLGL